MSQYDHFGFTLSKGTYARQVLVRDAASLAQQFVFSMNLPDFRPGTLLDVDSSVLCYGCVEVSFLFYPFPVPKADDEERSIRTVTVSYLDLRACSAQLQSSGPSWRVFQIREKANQENAPATICEPERLADFAAHTWIPILKDGECRGRLLSYLSGFDPCRGFVALEGSEDAQRVKALSFFPFENATTFIAAQEQANAHSQWKAAEAISVSSKLDSERARERYDSVIASKLRT